MASPLRKLGALGFSAMMHGYLPLDKEGNQLCEFRTWRNTITEEEAAQLTELFGFNIPQRWSIAHLYRAIRRKEAHVPSIACLTTLAGYVHQKLTGRSVLGVGEAYRRVPHRQCHRHLRCGHGGEVRPAGGGRGACPGSCWTFCPRCSPPGATPVS